MTKSTTKRACCMTCGAKYNALRGHCPFCSGEKTLGGKRSKPKAGLTRRPLEI